MLYEKSSPPKNRPLELDCGQIKSLIRTNESVQKNFETFGLKGLAKTQQKQVEGLTTLSRALDCEE